MVRTPARTHGSSSHVSSIVATLFSAALTVCAGLAPGSAVAIESDEAPEAAYTYDAVTGAAVTLAAGRTPGTFGVTHSGAATYRIPLWAPPGVGDVDLDLALVYNSRAGNGVLGQGWALAGLSAISRCNRTVAQDGVAAGVRNTSADRFCLDGQQLKLVSGVYGGTESVYATEIESFARIVATGVSGSGPRSFIVTSKNGLVYEYGGTADSRVSAGSTETVRTWALSSIRDRVGNSIALSYFNDGQAAAYTNGTHRIATITYPRTATGAGPFYEVRFNYSARAESDVPVGYLAGAVLREPNKLDSITVQAFGGSAPIKTYNLSYDVSAVTGRIRLIGVQECAASSCFRPTTVTYQAGTKGWSLLRDAGAVASPKQAPVVADFDGDGLTDLLYPVNWGTSSLAWWIARATPDGYATPFATGVYTPTSASKVIYGDFLGNGRTQFLVQQGGVWSIAGYSGSGFTVASTGLAAGGEYGAADVDGDGLADLVAVTNTTPKTVTVRRNATTPTSSGFSARFASTAQTIWTLPDNRVVSWSNPRVTDLNGDGRADLAVATTNTRERNVRYYLTPLLSNGFDAPFTQAPDRELTVSAMFVTGDWNADGCTDVMQLQRVLVSDCAGSFVTIATSATPGTGTILPADWDGDGRTDLLWVNTETKTWHVAPSTGSGAGAPVNTGIAAPDGSAWFVHDPDGDGLVDLGVRLASDRLKFQLHASATKPPDLAISFVDGFGLLQGQPTYASIARSHHERQSNAQFPEADFQAPLYVVSEFAASDGAGGTYRNQFTYAGARRNLQGRGFLGFETQRIVDTRTGLVTFDYAGRSYPFTGMHAGRSVFQADGSTPVSSWTAALAQLSLGSLGVEERRFPHVASNTRRTYEHGGALNGQLVTETTRTFTYADPYGNPTRVQTTTVDRDPASPFLGGAWQSTATYAYANDASANWCLGLPISGTVASTAPGQASKSRAATFAVDIHACRVTQQVLEPATPSQKVSTTYGYDGCGNLASVRVVGSNADGTAMPARTTSLGYGSRCQLPETVTNALGQTSTYQYRYDFGVATQAADPNGLVTAWTHDDYGRRTRQTLPDRSRTAWSYESCGTGACWGEADLRFVVYESRLGSDDVLVRSGQRFYDGLERLRSDQYQRAGGIWTRVDHRYDALGRPIQQTRPYSTTPNGYSSTSFDPLGRITTQRDHDGAGALVRATTLAYSGRTVRVTDPLNRTRSEVRDVAGRLRRIVDPAGGTTRYDYDAHGNLARIDDAIGGVSTGVYNARGFRTRWVDASAGAWTYQGNSLNELTAWTDARGQSFSASHDLLGRVVSRTEPEGTSRFNWGTSAIARNIGRLSSKTSPGYGESYAYDAAGRLTSRTIVTDQTYQYDYAYNAIGELDTLTYPASPVPAGQSGSRLKIRYGYSFGEPAQIDDVTQSQPRTLWKLDATNDLGLPSREALAAGAAVTASGYNLATGHLVSRRSGNSGNPTQHQNLEYEWDAADNLVQRRDARQNRTERFVVDAMDRLTGTTLDGVPALSVAYDAAGNIRHRSDVGGYSYANASRPHQATAAGAETLVYDANGNVAARNGIAQQWASFNLPTLVRKSGYQSQFAYGPDHQRWRQVATYPNGTETTHYVGGLLEKESTTSTGYTYWRHYV
ncbi:MAG TPA: FG-GAP-like repeat-containing protein, partial [Steroidobacteraceae bacterium]|nr:FG-GAP-like repeat-containing protein [Steroidobacteraceae bacterium]